MTALLGRAPRESNDMVRTSLPITPPRLQVKLPSVCNDDNDASCDATTPDAIPPAQLLLSELDDEYAAESYYPPAQKRSHSCAQNCNATKRSRKRCNTATALEEYEILREIARGTHGVVYEAVHSRVC